jgi:lipopolysaccharide export system ATP-binding protein
MWPNDVTSDGHRESGDGELLALHRSLEASELHWHLRGRHIVNGVDLVVHGGEIVGLLGPNGAGKTVTLSMIIGLLHPTSGRIRLDSIDVTDLPVHRRARLGLGFLPQDRSIFTGMSAADNIAAILQTRGLARADVKRRTQQLLDDFGLTGLARTRAARLSGGEQRRLEVARSLAIDPRFLLFDEPFAGIDPLTIESLHAILLRLRANGIGVLLTDHNVRETLSLCDRTYVLFDGRVLAHGSPREIAANRDVRARFLGEAFDDVFQDDATRTSAITSAGVAPTCVRTGR